MAKNEDLYAYAGKILRVNLSNGKIWTESTSKYAKEWLGASGIAVKILYDELRSWVTPYEPANRLIFGVGPLIGTMAPGSNKMNVSTLGPMTGGWASSCSDSYVGGHIKCSGYDLMVIEGKSSVPVYLWINDEKVEIRNASHLWRKTTWESLDIVRKEFRDPELHILSIGPAGENLVRGACIVQDTGRAFGRCGTGAVMGSKNLKAIVSKGTGVIRVAQPEEFMEVVKKCRAMVKNAKSAEGLRKYGTLGIFDKKQEVCGISYKNFQETRIPDDMAAVMTPIPTLEKYSMAHVSFPGCGVGGCGRRVHITEGPYAGLNTECNQWEVLGTLQGRLAIWEPTFMMKANALCNQLGLDVDAAGGAIGWAMECYQRGIIDEKDTDGLKLCWGDAGVALEMIRRISYREGFGNILAEGCARASDIIGRDSSYYALHIKGQDLYEPCRGANGWALGTMTSTRGGGHTTGAVTCETIPGLDVEKAKEIYGVDNPDKPLDYDGKAKMVQYLEVLDRVCNSFGVCVINTTYLSVEMIGLPELAELYSTATGWSTSVNDLEQLTMKQLNLEKAFNLRHTHFDRKDDMPTPRDLNEPIPTGNLAGWKIDLEKWNKMLDEYYELHGWDRKTSFPMRKSLVDLGLETVARDLDKIGKLANEIE
jgi:aldehyde:ferredoxin oxidoreductase